VQGRTRANRQPVLALYLREEHGRRAHAFCLLVLEVAGGRISAITSCPDRRLFAHFQMAPTSGVAPVERACAGVR
jgi:hypothetical protein